MKRIAIIGRGNVAFHLQKAFGDDARMVNPHTLEGMPENPDVILIAVKDDAIADVALRCKGVAPLMAHTSGSVGMSVLEGCAPHTGVFYPLQTFSKDVTLDYSEIPFFIEGSDREADDRLTALALRISPNLYKADSEVRGRLHIAAVFACNFSNHLSALADDLLHESGMDYRVLLPLLKETVRKLDTLPPRKAQTGPASRGDRKVMATHIDRLSCHPDMQEIYRLLSSSIMAKAKSV